jgi:cobalt-zinc-cadmium efflux system outer membrane protein
MVAGCAPGPLDDDYWPAASPLGHDIEAVRVPPEPPPDPGPVTDFADPTGELPLRNAWALALEQGPQLAVFAWEIRAEEAAVMQAGLPPNPELEVEVEDFGGSGDFSGFDGSETTIAIGQTILLGGKLSKRVELARLGRDLAGWDYEVARVDALTAVAGDFVATLAAQERLTLARESEELAQRIFSTIGLAANWGSTSPRFAQAAGDLTDVRIPPAAQRLVERIEQNPDLARWATEMAARRAAIDLARAEAVPDITLFAGPKLIEGADETAFVAGMAIPIPLFDRNQGGILEARIRRAQTERYRQAVEVRVRTDLVAAYQALDAAYTEVQTVRDEIEPSARAAFEAAEEAFRLGKIDALDLLDAQRTLFGVRHQYVDVLASYHQATIDVERLIGAPIHETMPPQGGTS